MFISGLSIHKIKEEKIHFSMELVNEKAINWLMVLSGDGNLQHNIHKNVHLYPYTRKVVSAHLVGDEGGETLVEGVALRREQLPHQPPLPGEQGSDLGEPAAHEALLHSLHLSLDLVLEVLHVQGAARPT